MKKHILIVSQYFPPDITAAAFRVGGLAEFLSRHDYRVTILTSHPHKANLSTQRELPTKSGDNVHLIRVKIYWSGYIMQYLSFSIAGFFKILPTLLKNRLDVVFATSPPLSVFSLGYVVSRLKRAPLIMDIRDLWPETPAALGKMREGSSAYRFFKRYEAFMYRHSHWVTCVSKPMKEEISRYKPTGVSVVYNGAPAITLGKVPPAQGFPEGGTGPLQVFYYGNIGLAQGLTTLIEAASQLDERFQFHLIGEGALKEAFGEIIRQRKLANIQLHDALLKPDLVEWINRQAHILFLNLEDRPVFHCTIPSKLFDYLSHQLPVVYGIRGEGADILAETQAAIPFDADSPGSLVTALEATAAKYVELQRQARLNNPAIAARYTHEKNFEKLLKIIENNFSR